MPIQLISPAFAQCDASGAGQDTEDAGAQADDFSMLLATLFVLPTTAPQPEPQALPEAPSTDVNETEAVAPERSSPPSPPAQPFISIRSCIEPAEINEPPGEAAVGSTDASSNRYFSADLNGFQVDAGVTDLRIRPNDSFKLKDIFNGPQKIEERPQVGQFVATLPDGINFVDSTGTVLPLEQKIEVEITQLQMRHWADPQQVSSEAPIEVGAMRLPVQQLERFTLPGQSETTLVPPDFSPLRKEFGNFSFSPAENYSSSPTQRISSQIAAAFNIVQSESKVRSDSIPQPEFIEPGPQATEPIVITSSSTLKEKASPIAENAFELSSETVEARPQESRSSTGTVPTLHASAFPAPASDASNSGSQSVTAQIVRAMTEVAGEVSTRREARSIRLRLHPEELGEVLINVSTDGSGRLRAQITVEHDFTHRAIAGGLDHLRETLEQAGVNLDRLDIGLSQHPDAGSGTQTNTGSRHEAMASNAHSHISPSPETSTGDGKSSEPEERLLSLRA